MHRKRWSLMQWCPDSCRFIPRNVGDPLPALSSRKRIPPIDSIEHKSIDNRARTYNETLKRSVQDAQKLLEDWSSGLHANTLQQYALRLACEASDGINAIPENARQKIDRYGLMDTLKRNLRLNNKMSNHRGIATEEANSPLELLYNNPSADSVDLQRAIESSSYLSAELKKLQSRWAAELVTGRANVRDRDFSLVGEYLSTREQCEIVARELTLLAVDNTISPYKKSLSTLCRKLGGRIEDALFAKIASCHEDGIPGVYRRSDYLYGLVGQTPWTKKQKIALGASWIQSALRHCRFTQTHQGRELDRPAFWKTWHILGPSRRGILVVNPFLVKWLKIISGGKDVGNNLNENGSLEEMEYDFSKAALLVTADQIPSLVAPPPWVSTYTNNDPQCMRDLSLIVSASTEGEATVKEAITRETALPQLQGLNRLQSQPWRINQDVLVVLKAMKCWEAKQKSELNSIKSSVIGLTNPDARDEQMHRMQWHRAIAIAESLGNREFYLPIYMDFRGRCYPSSHSLVNFMGNDSMRSLFLFGKSKPLGSDGLKWLEIHLANLYGQCKSKSYDERRQWLAVNRDKIISAARNPLASNWWKQSDKPYQTLAACFELSNVWSSDTPETYLSALPVQLDGTSNGLQHLVALARDANNASKVNMQPDSSVADVYSAAGEALSSTLPRSIMKHAVMTFFYGASLETLSKVLSQQDAGAAPPPAGVGAPEHAIESNAANEASEKGEEKNVWASKLANIFAPERAVQLWLVDCARRITGARRADRNFPGSALAWTTPLGLPVVQPYVEPKLMAVRTPLQSFFIPSPYHLAPVLKNKHLSGIVANYVHSLDAAHMLATARAMPEDCSFAAIHDSFWTHAGTVDTLNRVLREEFVRIHRKDLLHELREEWMARYEGFMVLAQVHSDSPKYNELIWSRDGVAEGMKQRELLETELQALYNSPNPTRVVPNVMWQGGVPHIGTPGLPHVRMWIPLDLQPPPPGGSLDIDTIRDAEYFFS